MSPRDNEIRYIQIFGERNSGTNYLSALLEENLTNDIEIGPRFGWKHGFTNLKRITKEDTRNVLFLVISKDPYSWLLSMNKRPHHAPQLYNLPFSKFIRSEWASYRGKGYTKRAKVLDKKPLKDDEEMLHDRHPKTGKRFQNPILLRNQKNLRYLGLKDVVENIRFIRYIDLLRDYTTILKELDTNFNLGLKDDLTNIRGHFGKNPHKSFNKTKYYLNEQFMDLISKKDLEFINSNLDAEAEKAFGYELKHYTPSLKKEIRRYTGSVLDFINIRPGTFAFLTDNPLLSAVHSTKKSMQLRLGANSEVDNYLFLCGCPRSGTTALWKIFSEDPQFCLGLERYKMLVFENRYKLNPKLYSKKRFFQYKKSDSHIDFRKSKSNTYYEKSLNSFDEVKYVGDKLPKLYYHLNAVFKDFEHVKVICIVRNIYDVANSYELRKRNPDDGWKRDYKDAVKEWNDSIVNAYNALKEDLDILVVEYERLFNDAGTDQIQRITSFLDLKQTEDIIAQFRIVQGYFNKIKEKKTNCLDSEMRKEIEESAKLSLYEKLKSKTRQGLSI